MKIRQNEKKVNNMNSPRSRRRRRGFTLMEVLLVLVILVVLGSMVGVFIRRAQKTADINATKSQIGLLEQGLEMFQMEMKNYPSTQQGLVGLREIPGDLPNPDKWNGPYLKKDVPRDAWDNEYQYELIDPDTYRIWSFGPDGQDGTDDDIES